MCMADGTINHHMPFVVTIRDLSRVITICISKFKLQINGSSHLISTWVFQNAFWLHHDHLLQDRYGEKYKHYIYTLHANGHALESQYSKSVIITHCLSETRYKNVAHDKREITATLVESRIGKTLPVEFTYKEKKNKIITRVCHFQQVLSQWTMKNTAAMEKKH